MDKQDKVQNETKPWFVSSLQLVVGKGEGRTDVTSEGGGGVDAATELILFDQVTVGLLKTLQTQIRACCSASVPHQSEEELHSLDTLLPHSPPSDFHLSSFCK